MLPKPYAVQLHRMIRHAITPAAVAAVAGGWLPAAFHAPIAEIGVVAGSYVLSLALSAMNAKR